ncbi:hypothetical protein [Leptospira noguchii]|uniref:hypothetical protein n=1 Tax=Leptospira noguchii TaxID=28182 RepID=UPI001FB643EF|nr:hypothetical protein [Leptospira noguchii]UOG31125.1 hypothetical protein MAL06_03445 [Leptospira noguchii]
MAACGKPDSPRFSYVELTLTQRLASIGAQREFGLTRKGSMNELKQNALLNSASHSLNSMHRFLRVALQVVRQVALTQQNAFYESVLGSIN